MANQGACPHPWPFIADLSIKEPGHASDFSHRHRKLSRCAYARNTSGVGRIRQRWSRSDAFAKLANEGKRSRQQCWRQTRPLHRLRCSWDVAWKDVHGFRDGGPSFSFRCGMWMEIETRSTVTSELVSITTTLPLEIIRLPIGTLP